MLVISPSKKIKYVSRFFRKATKFLLKCKKENNTMKKDNLIFIHKLLKAIADSIIKLFLPLYILKQTNDINLAMLYLIIYSSCVMLTMFILKTIIQKFGVFAIMVHFIPIIVTMGLFSFLQNRYYSRYNRCYFDVIFSNFIFNSFKPYFYFW